MSRMSQRRHPVLRRRASMPNEHLKSERSRSGRRALRAAADLSLTKFSKRDGDIFHPSLPASKSPGTRERFKGRNLPERLPKWRKPATFDPPPSAAFGSSAASALCIPAIDKRFPETAKERVRCGCHGHTGHWKKRSPLLFLCSLPIHFIQCIER